MLSHFALPHPFSLWVGVLPLVWPKASAPPRKPSRDWLQPSCLPRWFDSPKIVSKKGTVDVKMPLTRYTTLLVAGLQQQPAPGTAVLSRNLNPSSSLCMLIAHPMWHHVVKRSSWLWSRHCFLFCSLLPTDHKTGHTELQKPLFHFFVLVLSMTVWWYSCRFIASQLLGPDRPFRAAVLLAVPPRNWDLIQLPARSPVTFGVDHESRHKQAVL